MHTLVNLDLFCCVSETTDRWIEEDSSGEVGVVELSEGSLLLEVPLHCCEVMLVFQLVEGLVGRAESVKFERSALAETQRLGQLSLLCIDG